MTEEFNKQEDVIRTERLLEIYPPNHPVGQMLRRQAPERLSPIALAQKHVRDQEEWIRDHGATLEGYIERYGTVDDPKHGTMGGPAIYAADTLYLYLLVGQMRDAARRARRKGD